jgi:hypothetical protein
MAQMGSLGDLDRSLETDGNHTPLPFGFAFGFPEVPIDLRDDRTMA